MAGRVGRLEGGILKETKGAGHTRPGKKPVAAPTKPESKHPPIPGHEFLGAGYNAFGRYAHASADEVRASIFDFFSEGSVDQQLYDESLPQVRSNVENAFTTLPQEIKLFYAKPPTMQYIPRFEASVDFTLDGSISSEQQSLTAHVDVEGSYGLFAGEFSARYDESGTRLATTKFYSATARIYYYDLTMANYGMDPRKFMLPTARHDLNDASKTPEDVFDTYGTHYMYAVTIGSKIVFGHSVDSSETTMAYDAAAELKARYGEEGAGVGGGGGAEVTGAWAAESEGESIQVYCEGITDEQLAAIKDANDAPLVALQGGWHNPTLVDFPGTALKPIWDLCDDEARKQELQNAFADYAKAHGSFLGANANLTPLYLCNHPQHSRYYLLSTNRNGRTLDGTTWKEASGDPDTKPWLYVFNEQQPGTVALYEYMSSGDDTFRRYETSTWDSYLAYYKELWRKASGNPLGWVYDGLQPAPSTPAVNVYAYYSTDLDNLGYLYSTDSEDGRDKGSWTPDVPAQRDQANLEIWVFSHNPEDPRNDDGCDFLPPESDQEARAVVNLGSNVHWRAPTM